MIRKSWLGLSPTVLMLGAVSLSNDLASEMIYPLLPVYLTGLGATATFIGLLEGAAETTASLLKLFSGWIADRIGRKRTLTAGGYILSNIVRPLIGAATSGWHVFLLRFIDRTGKGIRGAPRDAILADNTPLEERGRAFGFNRSMDHTGAMLGSLVAFLLLKFAKLEVRDVFLLSAAPGLLAIAFVVFGVGTARDPVTGPVAKPRLTLEPLGRRFRLYLVAIAIFGLGNSSDAFLLLRAREVGVEVALLPLLWIAFHAVKALSSTPGGMLSDRVGRVRLILAGWALYALVYLGFSAATRPHHVWLLFTGYGLFYGLTEGVEKALVVDLVPAELRGTAFGVFHFTVGIVALPASVLCGYLWNTFSSAVALGAGAALAALAALVLSGLRRQPA